jgi:GWxTD domain-containing protein
LGDTRRDWLEQDATYIITPGERQAFLKLGTNEERDQFIETFWRNRNPDPDSPENSFKEEHYRRIAYANEHFASGVAGWRTDRGKNLHSVGPPGRNRSASNRWNLRSADVARRGFDDDLRVGTLAIAPPR